MINWFIEANPILQAFLGGIFTWLCTVAGSAVVFLIKEIDEKFSAIMQGSAAGVMTAATFWSLLSPAISYAENGSSSLPVWFPAAIGFLVGGFFLRLLDVIVPHIHLAEDHGDTDVKKSSLSRTTMLWLAVTIHNFPEGMAVGVAFAAASIGVEGASLSSAVALAIGIGLQNLPEGSALSLPLYAEGKSKFTAFNLGQSSALIEILGAVLGAAAVIVVQPILPYALAFAGGAMMFVVIEELIPESQTSNHTDSATMGFMVGFVIMMILDVALG